MLFQLFSLVCRAQSTAKKLDKQINRFSLFQFLNSCSSKFGGTSYKFICASIWNLITTKKGCSFLTSQGLTAKAYCICTSNWILMFSASWISQRNVYSHCNSYVYEHEAHFRDLHRLTAISWTITLPKLTSSTGFSNFNLHQWYFTKLTSKTMGYKLKWINWLTIEIQMKLICKYELTHSFQDTLNPICAILIWVRTFWDISNKHILIHAFSLYSLYSNFIFYLCFLWCS